MLDKLYLVHEGAENYRPVFARGIGSGSAAAISVAAAWTNDQQLPFLLSQIAVSAQGGAAQFPTRWRLEIQDQAGNRWSFLAGGEFAQTTAALLQCTGITPTNLVISPRWRIVNVSDFNAGAAANLVTVNVVGWYIARGTLGLA